MLRALIFDFNGVIVDDEPLHFALFRDVLAEEGLSLSEDQYYAHYLGFDDRGCFSAVLERAGMEPAADFIMRLIARKAAYYQTRIRRDGFPIFPGAADLIAEARDAKLALGLVSGALRDEVDGALDQLGHRQDFKVVVTAEDVKRSKPDPEGYIRALDLLNGQPPLPSRLLHPHEVVAIEDAPAGIEAARGAGFSTIGIAHTYPRSELGAADRSFETIADLDLDGVRQVLDA